MSDRQPVVHPVRATWNPRDWYWQVGELGSPRTQVYSSARGQYVPSGDPIYAAWVGAYAVDRTTPIKSEDDLQHSMTVWGIEFGKAAEGV